MKIDVQVEFYPAEEEDGTWLHANQVLNVNTFNQLPNLLGGFPSDLLDVEKLQTFLNFGLIRDAQMKLLPKLKL